MQVAGSCAVACVPPPARRGRRSVVELPVPRGPGRALAGQGAPACLKPPLLLLRRERPQALLELPALGRDLLHARVDLLGLLLQSSGAGPLVVPARHGQVRRVDRQPLPQHVAADPVQHQDAVGIEVELLDLRVAPGFEVEAEDLDGAAHVQKLRLRPVHAC
eukprot:CAMPEP_0175748952 /NCGR_PEP_ID=MMETSP0097-20121207/59899_1 /TAXON_ID=311494 /ORGANISM="Alexandrium monilatum, Strain CCMP3105" /LENGTH=161 /DNA_ID=CAMNT_0017057491 /DNA_START=178 /DNA_END=660 /DNA_ORIENTATION=+